MPNDAPQNFTVQVETPTSISLRWDPPPPESRNGQILGFSISLANTEEGSVMRIAAQSNEYEITIQNLVPYTTYACSILAFTSVGNGPASLPAVVTTFESGKCTSIFNVEKLYSIACSYLSAPSGAPAFIGATDVTSTSVTLSWTPPSDELHHGVIRHYLFIVQETFTGTNFTVQTHSHTTFTIGDLFPYRNYEISVQAVTVSPGPPSTPIVILTLQDGMFNYNCI